jgi:hypothetical protein
MSFRAIGSAKNLLTTTCGFLTKFIGGEMRVELKAPFKLAWSLPV